MTTVEIFAPAKINLTLHVTGRRADGYHLLDSLVTFAPVGDMLTITPGRPLSLTVNGPEAAGVPADMNNLVLRAATILLGKDEAAITLEKHLPVSSGIGGGSSDAAAAVRGCLMLEDRAKNTRMTFGPDILVDARFRPIAALGADVPMCLLPGPLRARGIGDRIGFIPLPPLPAVIVNPRVPVNTAAVFRALDGSGNAPMPEELPGFPDATALIRWLGTQRNDLEAPARALAPEIGIVLDALRDLPGCGLARMSGSGATCFGLFSSEDDARHALAGLRKSHPDWWLDWGVLGDMTDRAMPRVTA